MCRLFKRKRCSNCKYGQSYKCNLSYDKYSIRKSFNLGTKNGHCNFHIYGGNLNEKE